jgi:hypothetical protein
MDKQETFIYGEVISEPYLKWKNSDKSGTLLTGWECQVQTNTNPNTKEDRILNVELVYDLLKWEPVRKNSLVKLSQQSKHKSKTIEGDVYRCNVVIRK